MTGSAQSPAGGQDQVGLRSKLARVLVIPAFLRALRRVWRDPTLRSLLVTTILALAAGSVFYHRVEGLSWTDSWYLTVITLSTVGYGDIAPETQAGRLFTTAYIFLGIGLVASLITELARAALKESAAMRDEQP